MWIRKNWTSVSQYSQRGEYINVHYKFSVSNLLGFGISLSSVSYRTSISGNPFGRHYSGKILIICLGDLTCQYFLQIKMHWHHCEMKSVRIVQGKFNSHMKFNLYIFPFIKDLAQKHWMVISEWTDIFVESIHLKIHVSITLPNLWINLLCIRQVLTRSLLLDIH